MSKNIFYDTPNLFHLMFCAVRQPTLTYAHVDPYLCRHLIALFHTSLTWIWYFGSGKLIFHGTDSGFTSNWVKCTLHMLCLINDKTALENYVVKRVQICINVFWHCIFFHWLRLCSCALRHQVLDKRISPPDKMAAILTDDIFKCIYLNGNGRISIHISLQFVPRNPIDN